LNAYFFSDFERIFGRVIWWRIKVDMREERDGGVRYGGCMTMILGES
jgi:hypothetical protein